MNTTRTARSRPGPSNSRMRNRLRLRVGALLPALALGAALSVALPATPAAAARVDNPYAGATPYVNPDWSARAAAEPGGDAIADEPSFVWMDRIAAITGTSTSRGLRAHLDTALTQGASLFQVVIYDLPGRDCAALASNGELAAEELDAYKTRYIDPIASILSDPKYASLRIVALIEPDSLPNMVTNAGSQAGATDACRHVKELGVYEKGVGYALHKLGGIGNVYNYVDAGHHGWLGWDTNFDPAVDEFALAATSEGSTVDDVHGFIVNTANYSALKEPHFKVTDTVNGQTVRQAAWVDWNFYVDELSFAQALRDRLVSRGGFDSGIGMLIDTARNGWGGPERPAGPGPTTGVDDYVNGSRIDRRLHTGNWCNQAGTGVGERPTTAPEPGIDAYVWAKPPGESDGNSEPVENDEGKEFDRMCDPTYEGNARNGNNPTGAMADAPLAGHWFPAQFQMLLANAYPPVGGGGPGNDTQAPSTPGNLRVTGSNSASVSVSWNAATDNVGVTAYDVFRGGAHVGSTAATGFTDSGLTADTAYTYTVRARDAAGNTSAQSGPVTGRTTQGGTGSGTLKVQYRTGDTNATDNAIRMSLQLVNTGSAAQSLAGVEIRYWFADSASAYTTWCDWAQPGCSSLTHSVAANGSATGADHYLKVTVTGGSLAAGASSGEIQLRVHKSDWSAFDEADDYSRGTNAAFADAPRIGVYVNGTLAWGTAP
ncbi:glycoside hydrolase family 6 protein [Streptomyces sp. FIT100]|nr:glycoside hydrolase family 6 protein [Streptomyces sp. FIT100]